MRCGLLRAAGAVSVTTGAGVVAFVPLPAARCAGSGYQPKWGIRAATSASSTGLPDTLPPQDDTFGPLSTVRELFAAPEVPPGSHRYDEIGQETGGIWRTRVFGFLPCTKWATKQETVGNIVEGWPPSFGQLMGLKAVTMLGSLPEAHASTKKVFKEALSPKAVVAMRPMIEASLDSRVILWEAFSASGEEVKMQVKIYRFTANVISRCFLGDYRTDNILEHTERLLPIAGRGVLSLPIRLPWPLNKFPAFGRAMDARAELIDIIEAVLRQRREDLESAETCNGIKLTGGVLDELLAMQQQQLNTGGPGDEGVSFDNTFIFDNVVLGLLAGFDTASVQLLGSIEGKKIAKELVKELNKPATVDDYAQDSSTKTAGRPSSGILGAFAQLEAIILETARLYPIVPGSFRRAVHDIDFNGYLIPAGTRIFWNVLAGYRSEQIYPEPKTFCPFRFLHGDLPTDRDDRAVKPDGDITNKGQEQPRPPLWGYGKHMCPGRELARLEILLFLRTFLSTFDYDLVKEQSFKNTLPVNAPLDQLKVVLRRKA